MTRTVVLRDAQEVLKSILNDDRAAGRAYTKYLEKRGITDLSEIDHLRSLMVALVKVGMLQGHRDGFSAGIEFVTEQNRKRRLQQKSQQGETA